MTLAESTTTYTWKRSKTIAVLLAVFLGPWTWLYTFRKDAWKAAVGLGIPSTFLVQTVIFWINISRETAPGNVDMPAIHFFTGFLFIFTAFISWLWAVIDTSIKKVEWYHKLTRDINKNAAVSFAVFLGAWTWLYTYEKDYIKFWIAMVLVIGGGIYLSIISFEWVIGVTPLVGIIIWIFALVISIKRPASFYKSLSISLKEV
jgi:hypothetical protein